MICDLHGDHRRKDRADQIQEAGDVVHREENRPCDTDDRHSDGGLFAVQLGRQALGRDTGAPCIKEGRGNSRKYQNDECCNAQTGLDHDDGNVILTGEDGCAHADDIHPAGYKAVDDHADPCRLCRLFGIAGIVADQRQPRQRHRHRQLHRRAEGQAFAGKVGHGIAGEEDDLAQDQRKHEQCCHRQLVEPAQIGDAHRDPEDDQCADHQTPDPAADVKDTADSQCAVIDHDGRPADQLQHIQKGKQQAALLAEAHLDGLHSTAAGAAANQARQQHHGAADDMSDKDRCQTLGHAQRGESRARQNLRQRNTGTEPYQAVLKGRCLFHSVNSPFNANM